MNTPIPVSRTLGVALLAALSLAACRPGRGDNDTLAEGANDKVSATSGATNVGPSPPPVDSAGPGSSDAIPAPSGMTGAAPAGATLTLVSQGPHAPYVADSAGNALYYAEGDADGSKCTGPCLQAWPPVTIETQQPSGAPGLQGAMIATITRADGTRQVTFAGHPLYRYAADAGAGSANGDGVKDNYASWHIVTPSMPASGAAPPPASSASPAPSGGKTRG